VVANHKPAPGESVEVMNNKAHIESVDVPHKSIGSKQKNPNTNISNNQKSAQTQK
jgi:hypothetical protein